MPMFSLKHNFALERLAPLSFKQIANKLDVDHHLVLRIYHKAVTFLRAEELSEITRTDGISLCFF